MNFEYKIDVDHTVYHFLEYQRGLLRLPDINSTIRSLLSLPEPRTVTASVDLEPAKSSLPEPGQDGESDRLPRTQILMLVKAGLLQQGQNLRLYDFAGKPTPHVAQVDGKRLLYEGKRYSTSRLAADLLQVDAIRGPAYWRTESGDTVMALWEKFLKKA